VTDELAPAERASDADRDAAARALRDHLVAGRLTLEEFSARLDRIYGASTRRDLEAVAADLPAPAPEASRKATRWLVAVMGGVTRRGRWRLGERAHVVAIMGGCELDLRGAALEAPETTLTCFAIMGGVEIVVPDGVDVELSGLALMGGNEVHVPEPPRAGAPLIRVRAFALMGGVEVRGRPGRRRGPTLPPGPPLP
jgi:hypothetical protein